MSKNKLLFYEVHLKDLFPETIAENYKLISTVEYSTPWRTAYLSPIDETVDKPIVYHVTCKHFLSIKTMYKWFRKIGVTHGTFTKYVKTPTKCKIMTYSFEMKG